MTDLTETVEARLSDQQRTPGVVKRHDDLLEIPVPGGDRDRWSIDEILGLFPNLPTWPSTNLRNGRRGRITSGGRTILEWLASHPGDGWQQRWVNSGADNGMDWVDTVVDGDPRSSVTVRANVSAGLTSLLLCRVVFPSYAFLAAYKAHVLYAYAREAFRPDLFALFGIRGEELKLPSVALRQALVVISKVVLHTGRDVDQLTGEDILRFRAWQLRHRTNRGGGAYGVGPAWALLHGVAQLGDHATLTDALRHGQRPTTELVNAYQIRCHPVRDVLVRYLDERRPALDYSSFTSLVGTLVGSFWADIERHHPAVDTLDLPRDVAAAWRERVKTVVGKDGSVRPRKNHHSILTLVRGFYRDLQEWAVEDPSWAEWSFPSPIRKGDLAGQGKAMKKRTAAMHQRVRERFPHLPALVDTAERHKADMAALCTSASSVAIGDVFVHNGRRYCRTVPKAYETAYYRDATPPLHLEDLATDEVLNVDQVENDAFWAWVVIEVLRHTGVRIEELLEITHLGFVSYKLPDTGEVVPMLQIVPSKSNEERLLPID